MCLGIQLVSYILVIIRKYFTNDVLRILDLRFLEQEFRIGGDFDLEGFGMTICVRGKGGYYIRENMYFSDVKTTYLI